MSSGHPSTSQRPDHDDERRDGPTAAQILAGATIPIRIDVLDIELRRHDHEAQPSAPGSLAERLVAQQDRLVEWLASSEQNPRLLLVNPVRALEEAGVELDAEELRELRAAHKANTAADVVPAGMTIDAVNVRFGKEFMRKRGS